MTDFYADMAATSTQMLTEFGQQITLRRSIPGAYDPATGTSTASTTDLQAIGLFVSITQTYAAQHVVEKGDRLLVIDASVAPAMTDKVLRGSAALSIVNIEAINPAGTPVAYRLQVRGVAHG